MIFKHFMQRSVLALLCFSSVSFAQQNYDFIKLRTEKQGPLSLHDYEDYGWAIFGVYDGQLPAVIENKRAYKKYISPTRCSKIEEMPAAVMCISIEKLVMNDTFSRISIFSEGFQYIDAEGTEHKLPVGTIVKLNDPALLYHRQVIAGHNLLGTTVLEFFDRVAKDKKLKLSIYEQGLYEKVVVPLGNEKGAQFVIITGAMESSMDKKQVFSHEALHAAFFLYPKIQNAVKAYWIEQLSSEEREFYKQTLQDANYNTDNQYVLLNEFMAYTLNYGYDDEYSYFYPTSETHYRPLKAYIQARCDFNLDSIVIE